MGTGIGHNAEAHNYQIGKEKPYDFSRIDYFGKSGQNSYPMTYHQKINHEMYSSQKKY
ncbi:hypothetical protein J4474_04945 [Candidatus Pacearchaeota archaeon]|nr:hypothetical protein [Candidatus Pacearchaeota archaeon]